MELEGVGDVRCVLHMPCCRPHGRAVAESKLAFYLPYKSLNACSPRSSRSCLLSSARICFSVIDVISVLVVSPEYSSCRTLGEAMLRSARSACCSVSVPGPKIPGTDGPAKPPPMKNAAIRKRGLAKKRSKSDLKQRRGRT